MRRAARSLVLAYVVGLAVLVFAPSMGPPERSIYYAQRLLETLHAPSIISRESVVQFELNVLLFVPLVMLVSLSARRRPVWWWIVIFAAASVSIEMVQWVGLPGRDASVLDVIANTLGAALGATLAASVRWVVQERSGTPWMRGTTHDEGSRR
jgi:glycopeptide antibiotics resistance protein